MTSSVDAMRNAARRTVGRGVATPRTRGRRAEPGTGAAPPSAPATPAAPPAAGSSAPAAASSARAPGGFAPLPTAEEPFARVLAGRPQPVELAAVVVALRLLADRSDHSGPASPPRSGWTCPDFTGPRSWRRAG
jgi:acyl-CoA carboxylase epsilon subunit-like protein